MDPYISSPIDILIIIALKEEFDYFVDALGLKSAPLLSPPAIYKFNLTTDELRAVTCAIGYAGKMGVGNMLPFAMKQIEKLRPSLVVNIGISGLISDDVHVGDVVVAERSDDLLYRSKIVESEPANYDDPLTIPTPDDFTLDFNQLRVGGDPLNTSPHSDWFLHVESAQPTKWAEWVHDSIEILNGGVSHKEQQTLKEESLINLPPKLHVGPIVTGPWVGASEKLKPWLKDHDRNYLAMDVESWGVLKAVRDTYPDTKTLIIRGISDPSDKRKKVLDQMLGGFNRKWAISNAAHLFAFFVRSYWGDANELKSSFSKPTKQELADVIHQNCVNYFLDFPLNSSPTDGALAAYSRFFSLTCDNRSSNTFIADLSNIVLKSIKDVPLHVEGHPGSGKTSLLSILYWCLLDEFRQNEASPLPIYINLNYYNLILKDIEPHEEIQDKLPTVIKSHFEPLRHFTINDPDHPLIIIIDGYDEASINKNSILTALYNVIESAKSYKIIGSRESSDTFYRNTNQAPPLFTKTLRSIEANGPLFEEVVDAFTLTYKLSHGVSNQLNDLKKQIEDSVISLRLKSIDLFDLSVIAGYQIGGSTPPEHLPDLLEIYCNRFITQRIEGNSAELLLKAAAVAFDFKIRDIRPTPHNKRDVVLWELIQKHNRIGEYLTAFHVVSEFIKAADLDVRRVNRISYVYQYRINRMAKEILNAKPEREYDLLNSFKEILNDKDIDNNTKAQACYLAGRIKNPRYKELAQAALYEYKQGLIRTRLRQKARAPMRIETSSSDLLLVRTVYISLAYLGDARAADEYVEMLLNDATMDAINRGFHLEYYGDQFYDHRTPLTNVDRLGPCPATFSKLIQNLRRGPANNPLFEIELVTLCSLAQKRHIDNKLTDDDREQISRLLSDVQSADFPIRTDLVRTYIRMIKRDLATKNFYVCSVFEKYYQIKNIKREGWVGRGIINGESVADHTYGAYLIALFFLPDILPENFAEAGSDRYSKEQIIQMLLVHDLAEAVTGDILPKFKSEASEVEERDVYDEIALTGTYKIASTITWLADLGLVRTLWEEFENRSTYNARVAKDIDKLENLAQLAVYGRDHDINGELPEWKRGLRNDIKTSIGKAIMNMLEPMFNDVGSNRVGRD